MKVRVSRFAAMTGSGCAPRTDAIHFQLLSIKRGARLNYHTTFNHLLAESNRRCFDRLVLSGTDARFIVAQFPIGRGALLSTRTTLNQEFKERRAERRIDAGAMRVN